MSAHFLSPVHTESVNTSNQINVKPRLHQGNMLQATCCLLPSTKLLPVCCPSVAGYKGIHVAGNEQHVACCLATCCPGENAALKTVSVHTERVAWRRVEIKFVSFSGALTRAWSNMHVIMGKYGRIDARNATRRDATRRVRCERSFIVACLWSTGNTAHVKQCSGIAFMSLFPTYISRECCANLDLYKVAVSFEVTLLNPSLNSRKTYIYSIDTEIKS